jgi:hypothetical protein
LSLLGREHDLDGHADVPFGSWWIDRSEVSLEAVEHGLVRRVQLEVAGEGHGVWDQRFRRWT